MRFDKLKKFKLQNLKKIKIREKITKIKEFTKTHKKKTYLVGIIFIIFIVWFLFNFSISLFLNSSPTIKIEPSQSYLTLLNNQTKTINYNISIDKPFYVDITCKYNFIDISENKILFNSSISENSINSINITIPPASLGSGKKIYNLEVLCTENKNSTSQKEVYEKISFLLLTYELTPEEKQLKETLNPSLLKSFLLFNNISKKLNEINLLLSNNLDLIEHSNLTNKNSKLNEELIEEYSKLNTLKTLWEEEKYISLNEKDFSNNIKKLNELELNYSNINEEITTNIISQNKSINKFNQILNDFSELKNKSNSLKNTQIYSLSLSNNISNLNENIYTLFQNYNLKNYNSLFEFQKNILELEISNNKLNQTLNTIKSNKIEVSNSFLLEENKLLCNIDNCLNQDFLNLFESNSCQAINDLLNDENKYNIFNLDSKYNLILYNNSYYNYSNQTLEKIDLDLNPSNNAENESSKSTIDTMILKNEFLNLSSSRYTLSNNKIQISKNSNLEEFYNLYCYINNSLNSTTLNNNLSTIKFDPILTNNQNISSNQTSYLKFDPEITQNPPQCCVKGICTSCCIDEQCKLDPKTYPVLLIHGHSFLKSTPAEPSLNSFDRISYKLIEDGFIDAGVLSFTNLTHQSNLASLNAPISVKGSYYYDSFYNLGSYVYITKKNDNIDIYAIRLAEIVESLKISTGRPKVNIVSHSMGGLVVRRYIQIFGTDSIDKIILIGSPNHGVSGRVKYLCSITGEKLECEDMADDSILIAKLNDPNYEPKNVDIYTISGVGCEMEGGKTGDGIVSLNSSKLSYATNLQVNGSCTDLFSSNLHNDLININKYPQVYDYIQEILVEK